MELVNVITGGGSGIGLAAAKEMPKDQIVLITGRSRKRLENAKEILSSEGHKTEIFVCDVSSIEELEHLREYASSLGRVRSVVHAAGVSASQAELEDVIRINALGVVHIVRVFSKAVKQGGCIAVIGSCSSAVFPSFLLPKRCYPLALKNEDKFVKRIMGRCKIVPNSFQQKSIAYCITKNFVRWFLLKSAFYYAKKGIRLVCISPGVVDTDLGKAELKNSETQAMLRFTGLHRPGEAKEIGFLTASVVDERNGYLTGTDIFCDGGCTAAGFGMMAALRKNSHPKGNY